MNIKTIAKEAFLAVSLEELKAYLIVEDENLDEDALLTSFIKTATSNIELIGWQTIVQQTRELYLKDFPDKIYLSHPPYDPFNSALSVTSVEYLPSGDGVNYSELDSSNYGLNETAYSPYIYWKDGASIPSIYNDEKAIKVTYVSGYADATKVPEEVKTAIKFLAGHFSDNRELVAPIQLHEMPVTLQIMIESIRKNSIA